MMANSLFCWPWSDGICWNEFSLNKIDIEVEHPAVGNTGSRPVGPRTQGKYKASSIPAYFWAKSFEYRLRNVFRIKSRRQYFPVHKGYSETRALMGGGATADIAWLVGQANDVISSTFAELKASKSADVSLMQVPISSPRLVHLRLSEDLQLWKDEQAQLGHVLPPKGSGLTRCSDQVLQMMGAQDWPDPLITTNALSGSGLANFLMGAADAQTMFSNYINDMVFYYEHGYNYIFPSLEPLINRSLADAHALRTQGGHERREAVLVGKCYIQHKMALEEENKLLLKNQSAKLDRRTAQIVCFSESSLLGMGAEAVARGFDPAAVMSDLVFACPGTDVVDVGSDLVNSEVMNSFLNVADIADTGVMSEKVLRRVYDAYAATGARMLTQRWHEPLARMCAAVYS